MASSGYDGSIRIKATLDHNAFDRGAASMTTTLGKIGSTLTKLAVLTGAAFGVKALAGFIKASLDAASDLQEVQNVVDVSFGQMAYKCEEFAATAIEEFGMSEVAAKKAASTYMSMGKSMGLSMETASDMAIEVAKLTGDVASFYNISQDLASIKLKSIWTGETETLKDLGVVMTEVNLKEFALQQGITKSYDAMTQAERVTLRYMFVSQALADAQGDFARTSGSYANQVRVLSERFNQLRVAVGNAFMPLAQAVLPVINLVIGKLIDLANAFAKVMNFLFGSKASVSGSSGAAKTFDQMATSGAAAADAANNLAGATGGAGKAAKEAKKEFDKFTASFDTLEKISDSSDTGGGGGGGAGGGGVGGGMDLGEWDMGGGELFKDVTVNPLLEKGLQLLIDRFHELKDLFKEGFEFGLGDIDLTTIYDQVMSIGESLKNIFTDEGVINAANRYVNQTAKTLGTLTGSLLSVGYSMASFYIGGIEKYLAGNQDRVKKWVIAMFNVQTDTSSIIANFSAAFADIFSVIGSETGQKLAESVLQTFADTMMASLLIGQKLGRDLLDMITAPFIEHKDLIKERLQGLLEPVGSIVANMADVVRAGVDDIVKLYDEHIHPFIMAVKDAFVQWGYIVLQVINRDIKPVLDDFAVKIDDIANNHVKPMVASIIEVLGKLFDWLTVYWNKTLKPLVSWGIDVAAPMVAQVFQIITGVFGAFVTAVSDHITGVMKILSGLLDFLSAVFTGNFSKIWEGIKNIFIGIWDLMKSRVEFYINVITTLVQSMATRFSGIISSISKNVPAIWNAVWGKLKDIVGNAVNWIVQRVQSMINRVVSGVNRLIGGINNMLGDGLLSKGLEIVGAPNGKIPTLGKVSLPRLAEGAVIPPNQQFAAILGDQSHGVNIETPLSTMVQAFKQAMNESGYAMGGDQAINVTLTLDGEAIYRNQLRVSKRHGGSLVRTGI